MSQDKEQLLKEETSIIIPGITPIQFEVVPLSTKNSATMLIKHAQDNTRGAHVKLIFHFENIAIVDMNIIGKTLYELVHRLNIPTGVVSASPSPVFRNQWDFIFMDIPVIQAPLVRAEIIRTVIAAFKS